MLALKCLSQVRATFWLMISISRLEERTNRLSKSVTRHLISSQLTISRLALELKYHCGYSGFYIKLPFLKINRALKPLATSGQASFSSAMDRIFDVCSSLLFQLFVRRTNKRVFPFLNVRQKSINGKSILFR